MNSNPRSLTIQGENAFERALYIPISNHIRLAKRIISSPFSSFISSIVCTSSYTPIEMTWKTSNKQNYELRMRMIGIASSSGNNVLLFDCENGNIIRCLECGKGSYAIVTSLSLSKPSISLKLTPLVAVGLANGCVHIYELINGLHVYEELSKQSHEGSITCCYIYEGERSLLCVCVQNKCHIWEYETCYKQSILCDSNSDLHDCIIVSRAFEDKTSASSLIVTCDSLGYIFTYHIITCKIQNKWKAHEGPIYSLTSCIGKDYSIIISAGLDGMVREWNTYDGLLRMEWKSHNGPIYAINAIINQETDILVSGGMDKVLRLWNIHTSELLLELHGHEDCIKSISLTIVPHFFIISGGLDNQIIVWDIELITDKNIMRTNEKIETKIEQVEDESLI